MTGRRGSLGALALLLVAAAARPARAQHVADIQIAPPFMRMVQDAQAALIATVYDANGNPTEAPLHWASSNINIATVDATGNVHALAPGGVVITVTATVDGHKPIVARASVSVMRPLGSRPARTPPYVVVTVPGASPGMPMPGATPTPPGATTMPGTPMPPMPDRVQMDSMMRASVNCNEPFMNAVNPGRACWEQRAQMRDSVFQPPPMPAGTECGGGRRFMVVFVLVNEQGSVEQVMPFGSGGCPAWMAQVQEAARKLTFTPAQKAGQPVHSWVRIQVRPQ
ncbi:MAG TPA: Ig-like domain-containing protein [Gemmatimonadales bacterium]|jgi:hypothetical protein